MAQTYNKLQQIYALVLRFANVAKLVGLPPTPCAFDRFLRTADARCALILARFFAIFRYNLVIIPEDDAHNASSMCFFYHH